MRPAVAAALDERQMRVFLGIVDAFGGERPDRLRQQMGVVWHLDFLHLLAAPVQHRLVAFHELPLERHLGAIYIEALDILPGRVEQ